LCVLTYTHYATQARRQRQERQAQGRLKQQAATRDDHAAGQTAGARPRPHLLATRKIPKIAGHVVGANPPTPPYPAKWPSDRFDIVWVFTPPASASAPWGFVQVPQQLLAGDTDTVISLMAPLRTAAE